MAVKYIYKNKKPIAQIWTKETKVGNSVIIGIVAIAAIASAFAWWKTQPGMKIELEEPYYSWEKAARTEQPIPAAEGFRPGDPGVICY